MLSSIKRIVAIIVSKSFWLSFFALNCDCYQHVFIYWSNSLSLLKFIGLELFSIISISLEMSCLYFTLTKHCVFSVQIFTSVFDTNTELAHFCFCQHQQLGILQQTVSIFPLATRQHQFAAVWFCKTIKRTIELIKPRTVSCDYSHCDMRSPLLFLIFVHILFT